MVGGIECGEATEITEDARKATRRATKREHIRHMRTALCMLQHNTPYACMQRKEVLECHIVLPLLPVEERHECRAQLAGLFPDSNQGRERSLSNLCIKISDIRLDQQFDKITTHPDYLKAQRQLPDTYNVKDLTVLGCKYCR